MIRLIKFLTIIIIFHVFFQADTQAYAEDRYLLRLSDRRVVRYEDMMKEVRNSKLIFIGEYHDNELHHRFQLDIIKELNDSKVPIVVGLEMFTSKSQNDLDLWVKGDLKIDDFIKVYYKNWTVPWSFYNDILFYLRDNGIPVIGLNAPKDILQKVNKAGLSSLTKKELEDFPAGITCSVDKRYTDFIKRVYAAHGRSGTQFVNFCEALLLRDKTMAQYLAEYIRKNPEKTVVVLAGSDHAWKKGVPEQTRTIMKKLDYRVILPGISGYIDPDSVGSEHADYILMKNPPNLEVKR